MSRLPHLPKTADTDAVLKLLDKDGAVIVDNFLHAERLQQINQEIAPFLAAGYHGRDEFAGMRTVRVGALAARSAGCRDLIMDPFLNEACAQFLKPYCDGYQLNLLQASMIDPGEGLQTLHRDRLLWGGYVPREMEPQFSMIFALTDFRTDNGATQVVPGSHRWEDDRQPEDHEITQAVMSAGSVLIYTGSVLHGGGENRSDTPRTGLIMHFSLNWLRQEENMYLSCPPEIARDFDPD